MKKVVLFLAIGLLVVKSSSAQTPALKIAFINSAVLLNSMPEKAKADSALAKYAKTFQDQIEMMGKEYQSKAEEFQKTGAAMSDAVKEVKMKEIQDLQNRIESTQQSAQEKLQQKKQDVYNPILDKADKAIKEVAKEKGYDFIFDQGSQGAMVFAKDSYDITPVVKAKLGIK